MIMHDITTYQDSECFNSVGLLVILFLALNNRTHISLESVLFDVKRVRREREKKRV